MFDVRVFHFQKFTLLEKGCIIIICKSKEIDVICCKYHKYQDSIVHQELNLELTGN